VVSFSPPAILPPGKSRRYPFYRRLVGPQSRSGEVKICLPYRDSNSRPPGRPARSQSYTEKYLLHMPSDLRTSPTKFQCKHHSLQETRRNDIRSCATRSQAQLRPSLQPPLLCDVVFGHTELTHVSYLLTNRSIGFLLFQVLSVRLLILLIFMLANCSGRHDYATGLYACSNGLDEQSCKKHTQIGHLKNNTSRVK
jgi:hypothetical protein